MVQQFSLPPSEVSHLALICSKLKLYGISDPAIAAAVIWAGQEKGLTPLVALQTITLAPLDDSDDPAMFLKFLPTDTVASVHRPHAADIGATEEQRAEARRRAESSEATQRDIDHLAYLDRHPRQLTPPDPTPAPAPKLSVVYPVKDGKAAGEDLFGPEPPVAVTTPPPISGAEPRHLPKAVEPTRRTDDKEKLRLSTLHKINDLRKQLNRDAGLRVNFTGQQLMEMSLAGVQNYYALIRMIEIYVEQGNSTERLSDVETTMRPRLTDWIEKMERTRAANKLPPIQRSGLLGMQTTDMLGHVEQLLNISAD